jgi:hypothetical protein
MKSNPCLRCHLKNHDKNNPMCVSCDKRLDYIQHLETALNFAWTNSEESAQSLRMPMLFRKASLLSMASDIFR